MVRLVCLVGLLAAGAALPARAQDGEAEAAMDAYVQCLDIRFDRMKASCEPAATVVRAIVAGCVGIPEQRLERAILPFHRFYEEMKITMAGIRAAQGDRLLARLVEYRLTSPCAGQ